MPSTPKRTGKDIRRQHNSDLLRRMRGGDSLTSFDSKASWFPPRPTIKKDRKEMQRIYPMAPQGQISLHAEQDRALQDSSSGDAN